MRNIKLLDCTLRDGGYINDWDFTDNQITSTITNLTKAGIDFIEIGYLTSILGNVKGSQFLSVETASSYLPKDKKRSKYLIMADVAQFDPDSLCPCSNETIDGIRVVFYKRQIEQAIPICEKIINKGYALFIQPMVTIDYSLKEYENLIKRLCSLFKPYAISVVDSFGSMKQDELLNYLKVIDNDVEKDVCIGFHGHDNLQLSLINAISMFEYDHNRKLMLDASVNGMGRGAGNLRTELIANYMNIECEAEFCMDYILNVISDVTEPISRTQNWGYSPYLMLTALKCAHPNFATYLLSQHDLSVIDFKEYLELIPDDMLTKCTKPYVEELYKQFIQQK